MVTWDVLGVTAGIEIWCAGVLRVTEAWGVVGATWGVLGVTAGILGVTAVVLGVSTCGFTGGFLEV